MRRHLTMTVVLALGVFATYAAAQYGAPARAGDGGVQLRVLSNPRPDMLSGGDALIRVDLPAGMPANEVRLTLNGADVTSALRAESSGRALMGLVTGMKNGANTLAATGPRNAAARLTLVNHSIIGPVFSGPKEQPFICETEAFKPLSGGTLGSALDADCSIATRVGYAYRSTAGGELKPLADPTAAPADVATATTLTGQSVPYIVRVETGTINRGIYEIAVLHNPSRDNAPDVTTRPAAWNGRLIFTFGGGCEPGWYSQGSSTGGIDDDVHLSRGYAIASSTLTVMGNNCNELAAAETMMMVKEHFIEAYGAPEFTIGWGSSGGAIQQYQIADNYPGLLNGIITGRSFADVTYGSMPASIDARLLKKYFDKNSVPYTDEQKRLITGFGVLATMTNLDRVRAGRISPTESCPDILPQAQRYDPVKNPKGVRCGLFDHNVNTYGRDPKTGFARRPIDNVGVQYGLAALNGGVITKEQFLDLNEKIGGYDNDGNVVAARSVGDPAAIRAAYRSGRLTNGGLGLATTPIIDYRTYYDDLPQGDVHKRYHSFSTRSRLMKANGYADNHVILLQDRRYGAFDTKSPELREALSQMDRWLTNLSKDASNDAPIAKLRRARPADLVEACWTRAATPEKIVEQITYGSGRCEGLYPSNSWPRGVAGGPIADDIIQCQLKPVGAADYKVSFTTDEMARIRKIFATGVCDWSKPGVEQQKPVGAWQNFSAPPTQQTRAAR